MKVDQIPWRTKTRQRSRSRNFLSHEAYPRIGALNKVDPFYSAIPMWKMLPPAELSPNAAGDDLNLDCIPFHQSPR
jgi:hypothetical protein